jgi:hypothetical protein
MVQQGEPQQAPERGYRMTVLPFGDTLTGIESESTSDFRLAQSSVFAMLAQRIGILHWFYFFEHGVKLIKLRRSGKTAELAGFGKFPRIRAAWA